MFRSRKRTLWLTAALLGTAMAVLAVRLVRNDAAAARNKAEVELRKAETEHRKAQAELRALLAEHEAKASLRAKLEEERWQKRDGSWLCERVRCNDGDLVPVIDRELERSPVRDPFDDRAGKPRRRR